jgi:glycogen debranching enzyme
MAVEGLIRKLEIISVGPAFIKGLIGKQIYLRAAVGALKSTAFPQTTFFQSTSNLLSGSSITPSGHYTGVWCRDASYTLNELSLMGNSGFTEKWLNWIWQKQLRPGQRVVYGRGSPKTGFKLKLANEEYLKEFSGSLPTSIQHGYSEVYGSAPDIDSTALMISSTCLFCIGNSSRIDSFVPRIRGAIESLAKRDIDGDGLLEQGPNEDWMDSMLRSGKIVYSQAAWIRALIHFSELLHKVGLSEEAATYFRKACEVIIQVNSRLWNDTRKCYCDDIWNESGNDFTLKPLENNNSNKCTLTQDVALFLLCEKQNSSRALTALDTLMKELWTKIGPICVSPISTRTAPFNLKPFRYQNGGSWPWITSLEILARLRHRQRDECAILLGKTLPLSALEWINPHNTRNSGSYPFRTSIAAMRLALRAFNNFS